MAQHNSPQARRIALANTVLRAPIGSTVHGVAIPGKSDIDEMGVCIEPPDCVIGLEKVPVVGKDGRENWQVFEQYSTRTQPEGVPSQPGDLELTIFSMRKWAKMAAKGNPSMLLLLFVPADQWTQHRWPAYDLQAHSDLFISSLCGEEFDGYLRGQRDQMLGVKTPRVNRPDLIAQYGFDTHYAYHAVRVGLQGEELLATGRITLPIPEEDRSWLIDLRTGKHSLTEAIQRIDHSRAAITKLLAKNDLPPKPDIAKINEWVIGTYLQWWDQCS